METTLVTGGTGTLGRLVVARLRDLGRNVRVLTRRRIANRQGIEFVTGDLSTGQGIEAAVKDAPTIVHCAGGARGDDSTTRCLLNLAASAGAKHVVHISVVGAERIPVVGAADRAMFGYFASKRAAERVVTDSGLPWTMLRAAQFHELIFEVAKHLAKLPLVPLPAGFSFQPIAAREVAARLVELAIGEARGLVPDMAGPKVHRAKDLLRAYLRSTGGHRITVPVWLPGKAARAFRAGANLAPDHAVGRMSWEEFLSDQRSWPSARAAASTAAHPSR